MGTHFRSLLWITLALSCWAGDKQIDTGLRQAFEQVAYKIDTSGASSLHTTNPAQRLTVEFDADAMRLQHAATHAAMRLEAYGYGDDLQTPAQAEPAANGNRVEYRRGNLTEWYSNQPSGLEQGFTLAHRPGEAQENQPLVIALTIDGGLAPVLSRGGDAVLFGEGLRYGGLRSWDARGRAIPSRLEVQGREVRLVVEDRDAEYPLVVDPTWDLQQELLAPDGAALDEFGAHVSVSGDTAVIAAGGREYVFVRSGTTWALQQELTFPNSGGSAESLSISGNTIVIGDINGGTAIIGGNVGQGGALVFVRSGTTWTLQQLFTASDAALYDFFGYSVSVSGNTAVIGAPQRLSNGRGAAYVFVRSGTTWTQQQELTASDGAAGSGFGFSVSLEGDTAVIGAASNAAYVFVRSGTTWTQQQELTASDGAAVDEFGFSVSVSGNTALIGASNPGNNGKGAAYVFVRSGTTWTQQQKLTASDSAAGDNFGTSVSLSGDTAVIGDDLDAAYVFVRTGTNWIQQQKLTAPDGAAGSGFGFSVSLDGSTVVIGASEQTINSQERQGAAYVFVPTVIQAVSVTPSSGSGMSQTFSALYSDSGGASNLQAVYLQIGGVGIGLPHTCFVVYVQFTNSLYLFKDDNSGILGPVTPGTAGTVANSQCTLSGSGGPVISSGTNLTVPFSITFNPSYMGSKNIFGLALSYTGLQSGSQFLGTWIPAEPTLTAVSVSPVNGSGATPPTFNALYTDTAGASDVQVAYLIFEGGPHGCYVAYVPFGNALYLFNDADTGVVAGSPITAGTSGTLSNSQCTLSGTGGTATLSGNNFTAPFQITFQSSFTGTHNVYGIVQSYDGTRSALTLLGTWTL